MILLMILEGALILLTPIYIYDQANQVYTYGPSVMVNYLFNVVHIISILTVTYVFRKKLNPRRRFSITIWMLIWIVAAGIQFMNNELLLVGFASALGVLILFTVIENPILAKSILAMLCEYIKSILEIFHCLVDAP